MQQGFVKVAAVTPEIKVADPLYNRESVLEGIKKLLEVMEMEGYSKYAKEMIDSIDFDGNGKIELVNLEFLVSEYFKYLSK